MYCTSMARMAPEVRFNADTMSYMSFEPMDAEDMTYELKTEKWHKIKLAVDQILEDKSERPYTDDSICGPIDPQSCMLLLAQGAGMSKGNFNPRRHGRLRLGAGCSARFAPRSVGVLGIV